MAGYRTEKNTAPETPLLHNKHCTQLVIPATRNRNVVRVNPASHSKTRASNDTPGHDSWFLRLSFQLLKSAYVLFSVHLPLALFICLNLTLVLLLHSHQQQLMNDEQRAKDQRASGRHTNRHFRSDAQLAVLRRIDVDKRRDEASHRIRRPRPAKKTQFKSAQSSAEMSKNKE